MLVDSLGLSPCTDKCDEDARERNRDIDSYAKYGGLVDLGGGAVGAQWLGPIWLKIRVVHPPTPMPYLGPSGATGCLPE